MKKANIGYSLFVLFVTVLTIGCGRTSGDGDSDSEMPYNQNGYGYGQGYSPYGGNTGPNGAAALGDVTLTAADMDILKSELGASSQIRLADLLRLMSSNPADLDTVGKSITELTQILSRADDQQVFADIAQLVEFLRQQLGALKKNANHSERHSCGKRIGNRAGQSIKNLVGRMRQRSSGGFGGGGHPRQP